MNTHMRDFFPFSLLLSSGRTNLDCDLLEEFLTEVGGGKRFTGHQESGNENAFSCCVLAGMRSMQQRRVRNETEGKEGRKAVLVFYHAIVCTRTKYVATSNEGRPAGPEGGLRYHV